MRIIVQLKDADRTFCNADAVSFAFVIINFDMAHYSTFLILHVAASFSLFPKVSF